MLSVWAILPAQVSLPSLVEVVGLLHNWIRSPSRPLNEDHLYTSLFASPYKFEGPGLHFGAWFGSNFGPCFGFHFWAPFWAPTITNKIKGPKAGPKNGTQNKDQNWTQIRTPKCNPGPSNLYWDANKAYMIFIQRSAGRSDSIVQQTNNFNQRRKGNLGGQNCSNREHEYIHRPNVVKTCFACRRYTVKSQVSRMGKSTACLLL